MSLTGAAKAAPPQGAGYPPVPGYGAGNAGAGYQSANEGAYGKTKRTLTNLFYGEPKVNASGKIEPRYHTDQGSDWFDGTQQRSGNRYGPTENGGAEAGTRHVEEVDVDRYAAGGYESPGVMPRELPASGMAADYVGEVGAHLAGGGEMTAHAWAEGTERGLSCIVSATISGTLKRFSESTPKWPADAGVVLDILRRARKLCFASLDPTSRAICASVAKNGSMIPLRVEVLSCMNTTPHVVGWASKLSGLDRIHIDRKPGSVMFVSYPQYGNVEQRMPFVVDVRGIVNPKHIAIHAESGGERFEDVVRLQGSVGQVLHGSYFHQKLLENSQQHSTPGFPDASMATYVDWDHCEPYSENGCKWVPNIPARAIHYTRDFINAMLGAGGCAVPIEEFGLSAHVVSEKDWTGLNNTKHKDIANDKSAKEEFFEENQTLNLVFKITGYW